jgi:hypothetical protein
VKEETRRGAWAAGTTEAYEKSGEWTENGQERQATTTTNGSRNQQRHKGGRLAQHRKQVVVAAIDISKGGGFEAEKVRQGKRVETNGRLRRVWFSANNRKEASPDAFWSLRRKGPSPLEIESQSAKVAIKTCDALTILSEDKNKKEQRAIIKRRIQIESDRTVVQA